MIVLWAPIEFEREWGAEIEPVQHKYGFLYTQMDSSRCKEGTACMSVIAEFNRVYVFV